MPSAQPLPTVRDLERSFHSAVGAEREIADAHDGSLYDRMAGLGALCMRRLAERDQGEARALFFDNAADDRLDTYIEARFQASRDQDTFGVGAARLSRSGSTSGTILKGTRIAVARNSADAPLYWEISEDYPVNSDTHVMVPVVATVAGAAGRISLAAGQFSVLRVADQLWDTWNVDGIDCGAGTDRQEDKDVRAAIRQSLVDGRPGYPVKIAAAMVAAGASVVALYDSAYLGDALDVGLNRIYVGDPSYESSPALLTACRLAVPAVAVAGTSVQVLPIANALLYVRVAVKLWAAPEKLNRVQAQADAVKAVIEYFATRDNAYIWSAKAMRSAVMKAVPNVHSMTFLVSTDAAGLSVSTEPVLATLFDVSPLPRFRVADWTVTATIAGPS